MSENIIEFEIISDEIVELNILGYASGGVTSYTQLTDIPTEFTPSAHTQDIDTINGLHGELDTKVDKITGKELSTEDYTTAEKSKLSGIAENANNYVLPSDVVKDSNYVHTDNNYTTAEKSKLAGIAENAEVNVQADWNESSNTSDAYIKNKPSLNFEPANSNIQAHISSASNPHNTTKTQVGLGNVPNVDTTNPSNITQDSTHRFLSDAQVSEISHTNRTAIDNVSGANTGDETNSSIKTKLGTDLSNKLDYNGNGSSLTGITASQVGALPSSTIIPDQLSDLSDDSNHRTVTDSEKTTWNDKLSSYTETDPIYLADKDSIALKTELPTKTSDLTNDSDFATNSSLNNKVDKIAGKGLSTEDYTNAEKTKLSGIEENANNYVLPSDVVVDEDLEPYALKTELPDSLSDLSDDTTHRLVTDTEKTTWNAKQNALGFTPENMANKNANNGYCGLDSGGKVALNNLPSTLLKYIGNWNASTNTPTLTNPDLTKIGHVYNVSTAGTQFGIDFKINDWLIYNNDGIPEKSDNSDDVVSVNGQTGIVTITKSDVLLGNVDNTSDDDKPISIAQQTALDTKANLSGGNTFTGTQLLEAIQLLNKSGQALKIKRTDVFDFVQYRRVIGTWTDITLEAGRSQGTVSGDVLDLIGDTFVIGKAEPFNSIYIDVGTARSATGTFVWEYSLGGDTWATLTCTDTTTALLADGVVSFEAPADWATDSQNSSAQLYFVRLRSETGTFSTEPTVYLVVPNDGQSVLEIYANGNDTVPAFCINRNGQVLIATAHNSTSPSTYKLYSVGNTYLGGTLSGVSTFVTSGTFTNTLSTTGYTHVGGTTLNAPASTALIPNQNSPVTRFSGNSWNGTTARINAMDIYVNPNADPITNARMAFKNTTIDGYADANEVMNISSNGKLNVLGTAMHPLDTFDRVFHFIAPSTFTDDTLTLQTLGLVTADVINVVGDYLYIGKRTPFTEMYYEFGTIMSAGTTRKWEYSKGGGVWNALPITSDGTNNWAQNGSVLFDAPSDWATETVNATVGLYWARVGTVSGTFSTEPTLYSLFPSTRFKDNQVLSNIEFNGTTGWAVTGDYAYTTGDYTFTYATGIGTLRQPKASFNSPAKPNTWYRFRYVVGVAAPTTTVCWIGEEFSDGKTYFSGSTTEVDVFFKTNSDPQDFVIYTTATALSGFRIDTVSLLEMTKGDLMVTGGIKANGLLEYADNATALSAGLTVGQFYRTGDLLKVVH